jgi:mono/diheme cytochrome c family protein
MSQRKTWMVWSLATVALTALLLAGMLTQRADGQPLLTRVRSLFSPGPMTSGHYQIELACENCHTSRFGGPEVLQKACVGCHNEELTVAEDKHPLSKFTDPRNADLLAKLDARQCVTCHTEHRPQATLAMGVTQPADVCQHCHADIAEERPSHRTMAFNSCTDAGCHNFHDDRALYEDFLIKHAAAPANNQRQVLPQNNFLAVAAELPSYPLKKYPLHALSKVDADSARLANDSQQLDDWLASAHARAGVNCSACHQPAERNGAWVEHPTEQVCASCHGLENAGFLSGKHGMRLKAGLSAMTPAQARLPFKADAAHRELSCNSCHGAHRYDTKQAAAQSCLRCHADDHSVAYQSSEHAQLWQREIQQELPAGSGVSCASCHMPRQTHTYEDYELTQTYVQHNQNDTLRPNEKMIRPVCMNCHGLGFSIDALADKELIQRNFAGQPARHVPSIEMAMQRQRRPHATQRRGSD